MKKLFNLFIIFTLALGLTACSANTEPEIVSPTPDTKPKDIIILYTSDVHCGIDQGFGYSGLAQIRDNLAKENHVVLVDNGDSIQGEPIGTLTNGEAIIDLMNTVGYDIAIPGNHEFDYGMDNFLELCQKAEFPYISANFNKNGEAVFDPYVIKDFDGVKIAFVGVTTPKTLTSSTPKYFQDGNGNFIYGFMQDESGEKLYSTVQSAVDSAKNEGADYVVVMGHLGNESSCEPYTYADIIGNTSGIDALLDGHSHDSDQIVMKNKNGEDVIRTASGSKLSSIGYLKIIADDGSLESGVYNWTNNEIPAALFGFENEVKTAVDDATVALNEKLNEVVAVTNVELTINDPEAKDGEGNPIRIIRNAETNLGDLCADAYRDQGGTDVAIVNGGGIRVSIPQGDITLGDILSVHPFGNAICVVEVTGQQILDALEWGARTVPEQNGAFLQVSGLTYEIHTYIQSSCSEDENGLFTGVSGEYRVKNVKIGNEALDVNKSYTLASHNYMLKNSGDGFTMFKDCKLIQDEFKLDNQTLIDYITDTLGGTIGEQYADPYGDGRIVAVETE